MTEDAGLERIEIGSRAEQIVEQCIGRGRVERPKPDPQYIEAFKPVRRILGPPGQQHQQRPGGRKRHQRFYNGLALAVDPVQILQQQHRRPRRDHTIEHVVHGIDDHAPPQQGFEGAPARIADRLIENGIECHRPKLGMWRRGAVAWAKIVSKGKARRLQRILNEPLQQRIRNGLLERIAFGFDDLPILLPQGGNEFMDHTGLSDSSRSDHGRDLPHRTDRLGRTLQLPNLLVAADEGGKTGRRAGAPAAHAADPDDLVARHWRGKPLQPFWRQGIERDNPGRQGLAGLRRQDLSGLRRAFDPLHQMDRRPACFIDGREVGFDHMRDDIAGVKPDPDVKPRILQQLDAPHQFDRRVTGHDGMIVVRMRRAKQCNQPVATFLADDSAVTANRRAHGDQGRLQPGNRFLRIEFRDQIGRSLQVGAEHGEEFPFTRDTATTGFGCGWACWMAGHHRAACRAKQVASSQRRRTDLAKHPRLPPSIC